MPRISVLLPCRNAAAHLSAAMGSLLRQTFTDFEILAVDDGSVDDTRKRLLRWARRDGRVRVLTSEGAGIVGALRTAVQAAHGEMLARMDADDIAAPDRFRLQLELLDRHPDVQACGVRIRYFPAPVVRDGARRYQRWLNRLVTPEQLARDLFVECPIAHPALMVRRSALDGAGGYRAVDWPEDYDLVLRLWLNGGRLANVPRTLLRWRERPDRLSRTHPAYRPDAFRRCKVHYLQRSLLRGREGVMVCGAGPVGKAFARALTAAGTAIRAFVDVDPRKIGQRIYDIPVIPYVEMSTFRNAFAVAAVGSAVGRQRIRATLRSAGWTELRDFCAVA